MMGKKVIVAGTICLDITPVFATGKVKDPGQLFSSGKVIEMGDADIHTGGCVGNTGLAMKFLGADVLLVSRIGADAFGDVVLGILKKKDADRGMIVCREGSTAYSVVLAVPGVDRIFLHSPGMNSAFGAADIPEEALRDAALVHIGYPPELRTMYFNNGEQLVAALRRCKEAGAATSLDLAEVDPYTESGRVDWREVLHRAIPYTDFFVPSVEELCYMLDHSRYEEWVARAGGREIPEILDIERDIEPIARQCMECGAKVLMIKCGERGIFYETADKDTLAGIGPRAGLDISAWAGQKGFQNGYAPRQVLSGTGAGDTCIAAFLMAALEGESVQEAVRLAAAEGACCVEAYDALGGLRPLAELKKMLAAGWKSR